MSDETADPWVITATEQTASGSVKVNFTTSEGRRGTIVVSRRQSTHTGIREAVRAVVGSRWPHLLVPR